MKNSIKLTSYAKWILAGEHAVIRGAAAVVFPLRAYKNELTFSSGSSLEICGAGSLSDKEDLLSSHVEKLLNMACDVTKIPQEKFLGRYEISNTIPIRRGLGSSAALCANITRLCNYLGYEGDLLELGRELENLFHTNSSGLDVAVALRNQPLVFEQGKVQEVLNINDLPQMTLTFSKTTSATSSCVEAIQNIAKTDSAGAKLLDEKMNFAAKVCVEGLKSGKIEPLMEGIGLANKVFKSWNLYNSEMIELENLLYKQGALAVKPIGSGLGGYLLSLWNELPTSNFYDICLTLDGDCDYIDGEKIQRNLA